MRSTDRPTLRILGASVALLFGAACTEGPLGPDLEVPEPEPLPPVAAVTATVSGSLIRIIKTSSFSPPSPDPAGITYLNHLGRLLFSDSEVDEMSIWKGANLFEMSLSGSLVRTGKTTAYSTEPTGVAYNPANRNLFISDDDKRKIFQVDPGPDARYGTTDDIVRSFDTSVFRSSHDTEDVAYDYVRGVLYIADGLNSQVDRVSPGPNGRFDGVPPKGDDVHSSFDTEHLGCTDPEGIAYDSDFGHLYITCKPRHLVFHVTTDGALLRTIDISAASPRLPAGLAYAPSSVKAGVMNLWIVDRGVDNNSNPKENDGKIYEFAVPRLSINATPTVIITAPANGSTFTQGTSITFTGTASDPEDGDLTAKLSWTSSINGVIGTGGSFSTSTLSVGTHTITASVTDNGGLQGSAAISVTVNSTSTGSTVTFAVRVTVGTDDAEERSSGSMYLTSTDLELVSDGGDVQTVGMRFNGVSIPRGAVIKNAFVQFTVDEATSVSTSLSVQGEATDNAPTFTSSTRDLTSRTRTGSAVPWAPVAWTTVGQAGADQRTPNLAAVIQEIVNRPGWSSGNSLVIIITGTGTRTAVAFDDGVPSAAPLLQVEYQ